MPADIGDSPPIRRIAPIYKPLGYTVTVSGMRRYVMGTPTRIIERRAQDWLGQGTLLDLYPDREYWHRLFPGKRGRIDHLAAVAWIIKHCVLMGEYRGG